MRHAEKSAAASVERQSGVVRAQNLPRISVTPVKPQRTSLRGGVGQGLLLVEGLTVGVLGGVALAWSTSHTPFGTDGIPMLGLKWTPWHGGLLLAVGAGTLLACLGRRAALVFSGFIACGWAALAVVCAVAVARHAPGVLGFDSRDSVVYGVLGVYNLIVWICLAPTLSRTYPKPRNLQNH
ncbi:MAG TPA: hypothetical protein VHU62_13255 [Mycobacterium sp.]|nr:hypothetical protein [Mycobacterium sp.]